MTVTMKRVELGTWAIEDEDDRMLELPAMPYDTPAAPEDDEAAVPEVKNDPVPEDKPSAADLARMSEEDFAAFVKESGIRTVTTEDDATTAPVETEKET